MSIPKPPFHTASEELLYNIYLKIQNVDYLRESDISTLAKLNAILTDADVATVEQFSLAINALKGAVPEAGNTLEKLYTLVNELSFLKTADVDTLAKLNAILSDADLMDGTEILEAIQSLKGEAPDNANTLEKLHGLLSPLLAAWIAGGNVYGEEKPFGTRDNFALPFITANTERGRFDVDGNFLIGHAELGMGKLHIRANEPSVDGYATFIDSPSRDILFAVHNSGRIDVNKAGSNLLINGGWPQLSGQGNVILTPSVIGGNMIDVGSYSVVLGYNAASSPGSDPVRGVERSIAIGTEAGASDHLGADYTDSVYIGFSAGAKIRLGGGYRNTMIGGHAGGTGFQTGSDNTLIGYDAQNGSGNSFNTLVGSGTRAYNGSGELMLEGTGQHYMTAIGAGAVVRTPNTVVLGRPIDYVVIGADRTNQSFPGSNDAGFEGFKLQVRAPYGNALGISGGTQLRDGSVYISLGQLGDGTVQNFFRVHSTVWGYGGFEFLQSNRNQYASIELTDTQVGGSKPEMLRLSPGANANTGILVRPDDLYNTTFGYNYILKGTNPALHGRTITAFNADLTFPIDDSTPNFNRTYLYAAKASVTNHYLSGFYADVRGTDPTADAFAFHSVGSRSRLDGAGMATQYPVLTVTTDGSAQAGATNLLQNGSYVLSAALFLTPLGSERTGLIISPGHAQANGLFISPQQALNSRNYDGHLFWLQYSTTGGALAGSTSKPMALIRKHNVDLNGFDHSGAFLRMEENIGSSGPFIEAFRFDVPSNSLKVKFSVDRDGVVSIGQVAADPAAVAGVGRLYFIGEELKFVSPAGLVRTVKF